ncbi:MAG: LytR C-terminal domain-containing protein [Thermoleophilia bacterium]
MADDPFGPQSGDALSPLRRSRSAEGRSGSADSRQRRRSLERARRRRRRLQRVVVFFSLVALAAAAYLGVSRIPRSDGGAQPEVTTTTAEAADGGPVLLQITQDDETKVAVLIAPKAQPTLLIGFPGDVLIRASSGFEPLNVFLDAPEDEQAGFEEAAGGIEALLGTRPLVRALVLWSDLLGAASAVDAGATAPEALGTDEESDAKAVVNLLKALVGVLGTAEGDTALADMPVQGDREATLAALRALGKGAAVSGAVPGRSVEGLGFVYFEPDVAGLQALLGGEAPESGVSVEVQNGSGIVGIAQKISAIISPLGYTMLSPKNAEGFPNVEVTQLFAAPDVLAEADRLRSLIGVGTVVRQETLPAARIIIVVGKDLDADALEASGR